MKSGLNTKNHIIEVAGEIFADRGFRKTSVREICRRAGVNLAAINYHFGDKQRLYIEVLKHYKQIAFQINAQNYLACDTDPPNVQLASFIKSLVFRLLGEEQTSCFEKLMAREHIEPTSALDIFIEESIRPSFNALNAIVRQLLGSEIRDEKVILCSMSILGQCLYFKHSRPVIDRLLRQNHYTTKEINEIANHIKCFSLEAISGLSR